MSKIIVNKKNVSIKTNYGSGSESVSWGHITGSLRNQTDLNYALQNKQDSLISGTNIKTINGNSLLGSGDITIGGGGSVPTIEGTTLEFDEQSNVRVEGEELIF